MGKTRQARSLSYVDGQNASGWKLELRRWANPVGRKAGVASTDAGVATGLLCRDGGDTGGSSPVGVRYAAHVRPVAARSLLALVFVEINPALNPANRFLIDPPRHDITRAQVFFDVQPKNFVEDFVGRKGVLIFLVRLQFRARRFLNGCARNNFVLPVN